MNDGHAHIDNNYATLEYIETEYLLKTIDVNGINRLLFNV